MREALKNFILALFAVLFLVGIGWLILNNNGLSKPEPHPFPHPFLDALKRGQMVIAYRGDTREAPPNSEEAFDAAAKLGKNIVLWVDARPTGSGAWIAFKDRALPADPRQWIAYMHIEDVMKADAGFGTKFQGKGFHIALLSKILKDHPDRLFVINLQDYQEGGKEQIIKIIDEAKAGDRALISSPEDGILRDLREAEPTWLFGTSRAQVTRLIMLSQLFLGSSAPMRGDVFVWDPSIPMEKMSERIWAEVKRRKMTSVLPEDEVFSKRANAVVTSDASKLVSH